MLSSISMRRLLERFNPQPPQLNHPPGGLGIEGLPGDVGKLPCGVPVALMANDAQTYQLWMQSLLQDAVLAGPVCLLADSQAWVDTCLRNPKLAQAQKSWRNWRATQPPQAKLMR